MDVQQDIVQLLQCYQLQYLSQNQKMGWLYSEKDFWGRYLCVFAIQSFWISVCEIIQSGKSLETMRLYVQISKNSLKKFSLFFKKMAFSDRARNNILQEQGRTFRVQRRTRQVTHAYKMSTTLPYILHSSKTNLRRTTLPNMAVHTTGNTFFVCYRSKKVSQKNCKTKFSVTLSYTKTQSP